jgi:hypothetical protein
LLALDCRRGCGILVNAGSNESINIKTTTSAVGSDAFDRTRMGSAEDQREAHGDS